MDSNKLELNKNKKYIYKTDFKFIGKVESQTNSFLQNLTKKYIYKTDFKFIGNVESQTNSFYKI